jgi:hypothetical protein
VGFVPMPELEGGLYLVDVLFRVGPVRNESALTEADLEPWERRRGIEMEPWQADLIVDMSRAYFGEMHAARSRTAPCPWPHGQKIWKFTQDQLSGFTAALDTPLKESSPHGHRQRHRNPAAR